MPKTLNAQSDPHPGITNPPTLVRSGEAGRTDLLTIRRSPVVALTRAAYGGRPTVAIGRRSG